jgi:SAM-dependent methyltransferase
MVKKVDFDDYADDYNRLLKESTNFFSSSEAYFARYKVDLVRKHAGGSVSNLLEYGCGIGRNIPFLRDAFPEALIVGSDISGESLEVARRANDGIEFVQEPVAPGSGPASGFELIFVAGVFHHVPVAERPLVAKALWSRLAPGGRLFIFEHNPYNPVTRRVVNNCPYDEDAVLLKPSELEAVLRSAALRVERSSFCLFVPPKLSVLAWMEDYLGWLPLGGQYWVQASRPQ